MELRLPAPSLVVLVGPSSSGKSTWAAEHFAAGQVVSSDALRAVVGAGEDDQAAGTVAFELLDRVVAERMRRGLTTVIDTLGFDDARRRQWIALAHDAGVPAHAVVFDTTPALCESRNDQRQRPIPKTVLRKQLSRFKKTRENLDSDGFDGIHTEQPVAIVAPVVRGAGEATKEQPDRSHAFGLMVSSFNWEGELGETLADIGHRAEEAGFEEIWVMDHFRQIRGVGRPWEDIPEAYIALGYLAGKTSTIRLGCLVTGITHRHPIVLGKMIATLDVLSGGRAICGIGAAWDDEEHAAYGIEFPDVPTRYSILEETLQMLPLLWGKGTPEFRGEHIESDGLTCYPRPLQDPIPILVGGSGEKRTLRLVAKYADACNVFGDPDRVRHKVDVLRGHCADLERDPTEIQVTHLTNALAAPDRKTLYDRVESLRDRNTTPERYMSRVNAGTIDDLENLFRSYQSAGATHSIVAIPGVEDVGAIESFGDVISRFDRP